MSDKRCPRFEYEVVAAEPGGEITAIILRIDGHEFTLNKADVSHLDGIITAVYDFMADPFEAYLRETPARVVR